MVVMRPYLSVIILNGLKILQLKDIKWLNVFTKKEKQDLTVCYLQETHFTCKNTCRLKVKGWNKIFHIYGIQKNPE